LKTILSFLFISISSLLSGQYFVTCNGNLYSSNTNKLSYRAEKCKEDIYTKLYFDKIPASDTALITKIKKKVATHIGAPFYDQLELRSIISSRPDATCSYINYTLVYFFKFDSTFSYRFTPAFDESGNQVGDDAFPFILEHPDFHKLIPICNALKSLLADGPFPKEDIRFIELEYDTLLQNFVYKIYSIPKNSEWGFNGRRIGCAHGKISVVNAQTGEKIRIEDYKECDRD
jgi:hypothetical protein